MTCYITRIGPQWSIIKSQHIQRIKNNTKFNPSKATHHGSFMKSNLRYFPMNCTIKVIKHNILNTLSEYTARQSNQINILKKSKTLDPPPASQKTNIMKFC